MAQKLKETILNPILKGNPITVLILGICSSLAVTVELKGACVMALSVIIVTGVSSLICSLLRKTIPNRARIIVQLVVVAMMVILVDQVLKAFAYAIDKQLSVYIGLIITNCIVMGRIEAFALGNKPWPSFLDGIANGVGYGLSISLNTYTAIQGLQGDVKLYVYESIREDAYQLWGFATKVERELFLLLTSVSGVGGQSARVILSSMTPAELCDAISRSDERLLKSAKGIGGKTAQRIIVELKDKIVSLGLDAAAGSPSSQPVTAANKEVQDEAVQALTMLGFSPAPSQKAVVGILRAEPDASVERVIKLALKML